jgi:hypothetical protein
MLKNGALVAKIGVDAADILMILGCDSACDADFCIFILVIF